MQHDQQRHPVADLHEGNQLLLHRPVQPRHHQRRPVHQDDLHRRCRRGRPGLRVGERGVVHLMHVHVEDPSSTRLLLAAPETPLLQLRLCCGSVI